MSRIWSGDENISLSRLERSGILFRSRKDHDFNTITEIPANEPCLNPELGQTTIHIHDPEDAWRTSFCCRSMINRWSGARDDQLSLNWTVIFRDNRNDLVGVNLNKTTFDLRDPERSASRCDELLLKATSLTACELIAELAPSTGHGTPLSSCPRTQTTAHFHGVLK